MPVTYTIALRNTIIQFKNIHPTTDPTFQYLTKRCPFNKYLFIFQQHRLSKSKRSLSQPGLWCPASQHLSGTCVLIEPVPVVVRGVGVQGLGGGQRGGCLGGGSRRRGR